MQKFDVIVVGAGPAGGQTARELAKRGKAVFLADRQRTFLENNFSTAGVPAELIEKFNLPQKVIGTTWNRIAIYSSNNWVSWSKKKAGGAILDFALFRQFLTDEVRKYGGKTGLGHAFLTYERDKNMITASFKNLINRKIERFCAPVLVDATGSERAVLAKNATIAAKNFPASGIEYLVKVPPDIYAKWENALSFFMGKKWMPQGYGWIFPMKPNELKIGVGRYFLDKTYVSHEKSFLFYLRNMLEKCLDNKQTIIDRHGKKLLYTYRHRDPLFNRGIIAVGDAISSANPLAFEGIRHAMETGSLASRVIIDYLKKDGGGFKRYKTLLKNYFGFKWRMCESVINVIYKEPRDEKIDMMIESLKKLSFQEIYNLTFHYKYSTIIKFLLHYFLRSRF